MKQITFGSLFAGIGGIDLGFERAGMTCAFQVEIDDYCRRVLAKHWPSVPRFGDIRTVKGADLPRVDVLAGGFPCQDISDAGERAGIHGERSGLWFEFARLIRDLRPRAVVVENVAALLDRGMGDVLGNLADLGFAAEWSVLSACAFGAPHTRERVFILAYAEGERFLERGRLECCPCVQTTGDVHYWTREPMPARVADGVPCRMDRLKGLGNAVVPQVAELVGRRVVALLRAQDEEQQP